MKFNWGTGIAIFFSIFVLSLVYQVYRTTQYDHSLVSDHYYQEDIQYQQHYDKLANAQQLSTDLQIRKEQPESVVSLEFPKEFEKVGGEVHFFCPSDQASDFRMAVKTDENNVQYISTEGLRNGLWRIKVDWAASGKKFYKETTINI
jgi:nitrogen fixation protein FixH